MDCFGGGWGSGGGEAKRRSRAKAARKVCDFDVKNKQFSVIKTLFSSLSDVTDQWRGNVFLPEGSGKQEGLGAEPQCLAIWGIYYESNPFLGTFQLKFA